MQRIESEIIFEFNDQKWAYLSQYDQEIDYKKIKIEGTKAVDFIGILNQRDLVFFEIKNFRGHRIENKKRIEGSDDPIELEVAQKVRDTLAGIIGAARNTTHTPEKWQTYLNYLSSQDKQIYVILWLEEDKSLIINPKIAQKRQAARGGTKTDILKQKMAWLTTKVAILNHENNLFENVLSTKFL